MRFLNIRVHNTIITQLKCAGHTKAEYIDTKTEKLRDKMIAEEDDADKDVDMSGHSTKYLEGLRAKHG